MDKVKVKKPRKPRAPVEVTRHCKYDGDSYEDASLKAVHRRHVCLKHQQQDISGEVVNELLSVCFNISDVSDESVNNILHAIMLEHFQRRRITDVAELTSVRIVPGDDDMPVIRICYDVHDDAIDDPCIFEDIMRETILADIREHAADTLYINDDDNSSQQANIVDACDNNNKYDDSWDSSE